MLSLFIIAAITQEAECNGDLGYDCYCKKRLCRNKAYQSMMSTMCCETCGGTSGGTTNGTNTGRRKRFVELAKSIKLPGFN